MSFCGDKMIRREIEMAVAPNLVFNAAWTDNGDGTYSINQSDGAWYEISVTNLNPLKSYEVVTVFDGTGDYKWWSATALILAKTEKAVIRGVSAVRFGRNEIGVDNLVGTLTKFSVRELVFDDFILGDEIVGIPSAMGVGISTDNAGYFDVTFSTTTWADFNNSLEAGKPYFLIYEFLERAAPFDLTGISSGTVQGGLYFNESNERQIKIIYPYNANLRIVFNDSCKVKVSLRKIKG